MLVRKSQKARRIAPHPEHAGWMSRVREDELRRRVEALSFPRSYALERVNNRRAARWIAEELERLGLEPRFQGPYGNVVAATPAAAQSPAILIGAHYDSVPRTPGADDNASAVAAMLTAAEVLVHAAPRLPLVVAAFNREEDGLMGSADFVDRFLPESPYRVELAHILEMVGYRDARPGTQAKPPELPIRIPDTGDFLGLLANRRSRRGASRVLSLARAYTPDLPVLSLEICFGLESRVRVLRRSDHSSFWSRRLPALLWTDTAEFRNPHYHRRSDTPDTLDYAFLRRVTQLLVVAVLGASAPTRRRGLG